MSKQKSDPNLASTNLPVDEATKFFLGARSALKIGDMNAAERLMRRALSLSPHNYNFMLALARLLVQADKKLNEAEELLLKSSQINLSAVEPRLILATLYEKAGQIIQVKSILYSVLNIDSNNFIAQRKLSQYEIAPPIENKLIELRAEIINQQFAPREQVNNTVTSVEPLTNSTIEANVAEIQPPKTSLGEPIKTTGEVPTKAEVFDITLEPPVEPSPTTPLALQIAEEQTRLAELNSIVAEILQAMPPFSPILEMPDIVRPRPGLGYTELNEPIDLCLQKFDIKKLIDIIRDFFHAIEEQVGHETAFILLKRAKLQINSLYPELDYLEISEDYKILEYISHNQYVKEHTIEACATWMYLFMALLSETALKADAHAIALKKALPPSDEKEEQMFRQYFEHIQI